MVKRAALTVFIVATVAMAVAYASAFAPSGAPPWAAWLFALATPAAIVALMALGAARRGRVGRLGYAFALVFLLLAGGFVLVLALPTEDPADPVLWLGLPRRAAVLIYGIGLLPMIVVPIAYAVTFDTPMLEPAEAERVRRAAASARGSPERAAAHAAAVGRPRAAGEGESTASSADEPAGGS